MHCQVVSLTVLCGELLAGHDSGEVQELSGHLLQEVHWDAGLSLGMMERWNAGTLGTLVLLVRWYAGTLERWNATNWITQLRKAQPGVELHSSKPGSHCGLSLNIMA